MVNLKRCLGKMVILIVLGMIIISCDDGKTDSTVSNTTGNPPPVTTPAVQNENGTWYSSGNMHKYYFNRGAYEYAYNGINDSKGNYTISNNKDSITMTITHIFTGGNRLSIINSYNLTASTWYTKDQIKNSYLTKVRNDLIKQYQDTYNYYVTESGSSWAILLFEAHYGTTNINTIVNNLMIQGGYETSIESILSSLFNTSTVAYSLRDNVLTIRGVRLTKN